MANIELPGSVALSPDVVVDAEDGKTANDHGAAALENAEEVVDELPKKVETPRGHKLPDASSRLPLIEGPHSMDMSAHQLFRSTLRHHLHVKGLAMLLALLMVPIVVANWGIDSYAVRIMRDLGIDPSVKVETAERSRLFSAFGTGDTAMYFWAMWLKLLVGNYATVGLVLLFLLVWTKFEPFNASLRKCHYYVIACFVFYSSFTLGMAEGPGMPKIFSSLLSVGMIISAAVWAGRAYSERLKVPLLSKILVCMIVGYGGKSFFFFLLFFFPALIGTRASD